MQLMPSLKVSIITVVYNRKKTIERSIESVQKQTYQEIEYIVVDGGSVDGTVDILQTYNDGRISKLISEPDGVIYSALNKGLQLASGDVLGCIHSDDFWHMKMCLRNWQVCLKKTKHVTWFMVTYLFLIQKTLAKSLEITGASSSKPG
jgi:glycosyltransferase involved in cell wall biosynthesis